MTVNKLMCPVYQCGGLLKIIENEKRGILITTLQCNNFEQHKFVIKKQIVREIFAEIEKDGIVLGNKDFQDIKKKFLGDEE